MSIGDKIYYFEIYILSVLCWNFYKKSNGYGQFKFSNSPPIDKVDSKSLLDIKIALSKYPFFIPRKIRYLLFPDSNCN